MSVDRRRFLYMGAILAAGSLAACADRRPLPPTETIPANPWIDLPAASPTVLRLTDKFQGQNLSQIPASVNVVELAQIMKECPIAVPTELQIRDTLDQDKVIDPSYDAERKVWIIRLATFDPTDLILTADPKSQPTLYSKFVSQLLVQQICYASVLGDKITTPISPKLHNDAVIQANGHVSNYNQRLQTHPSVLFLKSLPRR